MEQVLGNRKQFGRDFALGQDQLSHVGRETGRAPIQLFRERNRALGIDLEPEMLATELFEHARPSTTVGRGRLELLEQLNRIPNRTAPDGGPIPVHRRFQTLEHGCAECRIVEAVLQVIQRDDREGMRCCPLDARRPSRALRDRRAHNPRRS